MIGLYKTKGRVWYDMLGSLSITMSDWSFQTLMLHCSVELLMHDWSIQMLIRDWFVQMLIPSEPNIWLVLLNSSHKPANRKVVNNKMTGLEAIIDILYYIYWFFSLSDMNRNILLLDTLLTASFWLNVIDEVIRL